MLEGEGSAVVVLEGCLPFSRGTLTTCNGPVSLLLLVARGGM